MNLSRSTGGLEPSAVRTGGARVAERIRWRYTVVEWTQSGERARLGESSCSIPALTLKLRGFLKFGSKNEASGRKPAIPAAVKYDALEALEVSGTNGKTNSGWTDWA